MTVTCLNCGHVLGGRFCESCGQRAGLQPITLRALAQQAPKVVFDIDRGIWHTLKGLLMRPGDVINGYLDGRRIRYTNPLALMLLLSSINAVLFLSGWLDFSKLANAQSPGVQEFASTLTRWTFQYYGVVFLATVPLVAAITWCFFAACRRNYAEHLVINTYIAALLSAFMTCLFPLFLWVSDAWLAVAWNSMLPMSLVYHGFALVKVLGPQTVPLKFVLRVLAALVLYYLITILMFSIVVAVYAARAGLHRS